VYPPAARAENVSDALPLVADETFGPIMPLLPFTETADLVARVNSTPYGLQAGVFTDSMAAAKQLFECVSPRGWPS
jgi:acyl-CoA reductase-like NAD-dependent aldehyde dehydrogenase